MATGTAACAVVLAMRLMVAIAAQQAIERPNRVRWDERIAPSPSI